VKKSSTAANRRLTLELNDQRPISCGGACRLSHESRAIIETIALFGPDPFWPARDFARDAPSASADHTSAVAIHDLRKNTRIACPIRALRRGALLCMVHLYQSIQSINQGLHVEFETLVRFGNSFWVATGVLSWRHSRAMRLYE
jgi:hypothetical protein